MPATKRITIVYSCNHAGPKLDPVKKQYWNSCPVPGAVCYCVSDAERGAGYFKATPMTTVINVEEVKPQ